MSIIIIIIIVSNQVTWVFFCSRFTSEGSARGRGPYTAGLGLVYDKPGPWCS